MGNMGSAHPLVEVNVSFKFEGNPSISKGVIERTRIGRRTDGRTDRPTRQSESSIAPPPTFCGGGIINNTVTRNHASKMPHLQPKLDQDVFVCFLARARFAAAPGSSVGQQETGRRALTGLRFHLHTLTEAHTVRNGEIYAIFTMRSHKAPNSTIPFKSIRRYNFVKRP